MFEKIFMERYPGPMVRSLRDKMILGIGGHNAEELAFRLRQYAWNVSDRLRLTIGFQNKDQGGRRCTDFGSFFYKQHDLLNIPSFYVQQPEAKRFLIQRAEAICAHRYDLLGYKNLYFDHASQVDWHFDPVHNRPLPRYWWKRMLKSDSLNGADPKIVWELNRHQHLVTLAQAYLVTGEERYRSEVIHQLRSWMDANPPKYGINWASSLELAYRSIAWLWAWYICGSGNVFGELTERFVAMLGMHAEHIEHNLSVYFSPNTHLSGEALGLYYIGTLLPGLKGAERWRSIGRRWLVDCLDSHILPDGGYLERTLWYHRYTIDIYLHFYLLGLQNDDPAVLSLTEPLQKLGAFLAYSLQPDAKLPHIGDDDGGRLLSLDGFSGDNPSGIFSILAVICRSKEFASLAGAFSEEALWLLGPTTFVQLQQIVPQQPVETSKVFMETGYAFLRSGWQDDDVYLSFDCGKHGWLNCGHAHADMLSLQVYAGCRSIIRDPGTCSYMNPWRDWFRNAESHAIVRVDGEYPAVPAGPFQWSAIPRLSAARHSLTEKIDYVAGTMEAGVWQHTREIFFLKPDLIVLLDRIDVTGRHEIELRFPLADTEWCVSNDVCTSISSGPACSIQCEANQSHQGELFEGWQSTCYGQREAAFILLFKVVVAGPHTIATLIDLSGIDHCIRRLPQGNGEAFVIETLQGGKAVATIKSSMKEDAICAAFAE
jgi:hypothetical protein